MSSLSYDIRGIQQIIFAVPNLRCIIGASNLVAEFDQKIATWFRQQKIPGQLIYGSCSRG